MSSGRVESQYLVGAFSPAGHSISSHSSARGSASRREHARERTARTAARPCLPAIRSCARRAGEGHAPITVYGAFIRRKLIYNQIFKLAIAVVSCRSDDHF